MPSRIVYTSRNDAVGQTKSTLMLRDLSSGKEREIYTGNDDYLACSWSAKINRLLCGEDAPRRTDFLSIDLDSGKSERLGSLPGTYYLLQASPDGRALYLLAGPGTALKRWEVATGKISTLDETGTASPSKDENWLLRANWDNSDLEVRPAARGSWRKVASFGSGAVPCFTPDSQLILYTAQEAGKLFLFRVPVTGGTAERLGDYPRSSGGTMSISPDGKKMLAAAWQETSELSMLENFVPKASTVSAAAR